MASNAAVLASIPAGTTIARRTGWKDTLVAAQGISLVRPASRAPTNVRRDDQGAMRVAGEYSEG
jgi:predicted MFS family arabinose efflux permease